MAEIQPLTESEGKGLRQLMEELKAALDEQDRLMRPRCFDDPRQDPIVDCQCPACLDRVPEAEGDATGEP